MELSNDGASAQWLQRILSFHLKNEGKTLQEIARLKNHSKELERIKKK